MALQTRPPAAQGPRRPSDRLPRSSTGTGRGREIRLGLLGTAGILVLVVGIPLALCLLVGYPLPRHAPSRDWLTTSVTATLIIKVLACVVWLVWAHFTVCLLTEWRAIRRGRLPGSVPLGGGSQFLARRLVAAALLLAGAATAYANSGVGPAAHRPATVASQHAGAPVANRAAQAGIGSAAAGDASERTHASPHQQETKYYVVVPPHGRRYDSLWDIADRTLKDPLRYKEIFALNKDRIQSDGRKLVDANLIQPGWQLRLPADASGPGVHVAGAAAPTHRAPGVGDAAPAEAPPNADANPAHASVGSTSGLDLSGTGATVTSGSAASAEHGNLGGTVFGGGLILAGLLMALTTRRGPYAPADSEDDDLPTGGDPTLVDLMDKALRELARGRAEQRRPLPHPAVAWASHERILLNFSGGDTAEPPEPWQSGEDGRSWELAVSLLPAGPAPDVPAPFPGLLSIGHSDGFELFLDVEQAPGPISVSGDLGRGRELFLALAVQAVTCRWNDGAKVIAVGFAGEDLAVIAPRSISQVARLSDVLPELEHGQHEVERLQRELGVEGVLAGRQLHRSDVWQPNIVLLSGPPTPEESARLQKLVAGRSSVTVLILGDVAGAPWRFTLDPGGRLDLGALGVSATAHRLSSEAARELVAAFTRADADRPRLSAQVAALQPAAGLTTPPGPVRSASAPVVASVSLLGAVSVDASGPIEDSRRALATEIVVAVALHADGLHDAVLRASIWPRGVSEDVFAAAMSGVQAWLGRDHAGRECLHQFEDGTWRLSDAVRVDWHELQALAASAADGFEVATLTRAVELFQGEAFSATPGGRYDWLTFARAARDARVLGTAVAKRLAGLFMQDQRRGNAVRVLRRGLVLVPTAEPLWRELLTLSSGDDPDAAVVVATELYSVLRARRIWPEPETDALIAQVAPGFDENFPSPHGASVASA